MPIRIFTWPSGMHSPRWSDNCATTPNAGGGRSRGLGKELVVNREPGDRNAHQDIYVAIRDAFSAMERQLRDYAQRRRGEIKRDVAPMHATVSKLFPEEDYGFI